MLLSGLALDWLIWYNKGMQNSRTYTPNPSAPLPYGLWLDLPFRTKGSTAIRSKAKALGARFVPNAKPYQWWLPCRFITQDSLDWFNSVNAIVGERQAPVFNTSIKWSDIDHTKTFTVILRMPYDQKDIAKSDGAFWDSYEKAWYFPKKNFTEDLFNKYAKMKAISRVIYPAYNTPSRLMFFTDDMGAGVTTAATPVAVSESENKNNSRHSHILEKHYNHHRLGCIRMSLQFMIHTDDSVTTIPYIDSKPCRGDKKYDGIMVDTVKSLTNGTPKNMVGFNTLFKEHISKDTARILWDSLTMQDFRCFDACGR